MAREVAPKKQRVFNTGNGVTKPVWNNADRINHANHFVPRSVILISGRLNVNSVRPNVNTVRTNINSVRQNVNSVWSNVNTGSFNVNFVRPKQPVPTSTSPNFSSERPHVNKFNQRSNFSKSHSSVRRPFAKNTAQMFHSHALKGNWGSTVKTSAGYNWRSTRPNSNCNGGPTFIRTVITKGPQGRPKPVQAWVTRINWRILKNSMGGSVTFGGSKGYITGIAWICRCEEGVIRSLFCYQSDTFQRSLDTINRTCVIEAARTMLVRVSLTIFCFWAEAVSTACYIFNRGLHQATRAPGMLPFSYIPRRSMDSRGAQLTSPYALEGTKKDIMLVQDISNERSMGELIIFFASTSCIAEQGRNIFISLDKMYTCTDLMIGNPQHVVGQFLDKDFSHAQCKKQDKLWPLQTTEGICSCLQIAVVKYCGFKNQLLDLCVKAAITPMETKVPLTKDEEAFDVDVHLYRSMIGSLMYLTASRPDIMYAVCVCSRFQVTPKTSHLNAVKRIFKYLKGKPHLGLWYPRESPFDLEAFSDSDYGGSNLDRKSTTGGCQFLGQRLISWQCKKQTIVATSTTEAEYVAAANCCGQVLWVQNQLLDYGFNFMNTKIHIDNESTICIVKNPVYHSKTKHIEIRHHFIRDCYEKKLISVEKIHTDLNVADLLTKPFDGPRFNYLVVSIGFAEIVDFLRGSNLRYALTTNPTIYDSLVKQFWQTATTNTHANGTLEIKATIDTIRYTISEASIRESLQLEDATGITMLPNDELFEGMGQMGYPTDGTFTFWKSFFTPQWRFLVHHLLHCISSKSGGWDQFGSNIATALICLSTARKSPSISFPFKDLKAWRKKDISRDDLTELYRIVMNRYGMDGPEDELEKVPKRIEFSPEHTVYSQHGHVLLVAKGLILPDVMANRLKLPAVLAIREGKIQKDKKKPQGAKGKDKGKNKLAYDPKPKISPPPKRDNLAKGSVCHHWKEVGYWRRNYPFYQAELKKRKNAKMASTSGIFTIERYAFPNKTWVYDMGCGTHICNTLQGLRESRKLKHGALSLYMGNGMRAAVEAIGSFDLILPSGLIVVLDNFHFAPSVTRDVLISCLFPRDGYQKEIMGYYLYYLLENNIFVARNAEFFKNSLMVQEARGNHGLLESIPIRRSARIPQAPDRYGFYVDVEEYELGDFNEPPNYKAALSDPEFDKWLEAMNTEMQSIKDNQVWVLVDLPLNGQTFGKAIRILLAIVAFYDYEIWQMDVKIAFLNGRLSEDLYMVQPEGFVDPKHPNKCFSMKDLGEATYILEIKITRDRSKRLIALSQIAYLEKIQKNFLMENSKKGYTLMIEKPDYRKSQGAKLLVRYNDHGTTVKAILKYLRNTKDMILVYGAKPEAKLKVSCYADASFQTDKNDNKPKRDMCSYLMVEA
ncbi:putative ribonuclease H-like domain-containing protein [Tanacetum coccineum]